LVASSAVSVAGKEEVVAGRGVAASKNAEGVVFLA